MPVLRPFRPLRYNPLKVRDLAAVVAPPYDVIGPARRDALYERDPCNVVRLILNREPDPYAAAAATLAAWRRDEILVQVPEPVVACHVEHFSLPDGRRLLRTGLLAAVRLEPFETGRIRPHERTFARPKEDRLRLITACRANLSAVFGLYDGPPSALDPLRQETQRRPPDIALHDDMGVGHRVWLVPDGEAVAAVRAALHDAVVFIADGHHRYETALLYREQRRAAEGEAPEAAWNHVLMYLTSTADPGLVILPTHRLLSAGVAPDPAAVVGRLRQACAVESVPRPRLAQEVTARAGRGVVGVLAAGLEGGLLVSVPAEGTLAAALAGLPPEVRRLDVTVLDRAILRGLLGIDCTAAAERGAVTYTHDHGEAAAAVGTTATVAFLVAPPRIEDVVAVCLAGQLMPEKSTYFHPKLLSGLLFHLLD